MGDNLKNSVKQVSDRLLQPDKGLFLQRIAETSPDIFYIINLDTFELIYSNRLITTDLGYLPEESSKMENLLFDVMHPEDIPSMNNHLKEMKSAKDGEVRQIEYRLISKNGEQIWFLDRNSVFKRDDKGIPVEKIGIAQNITERKLAQHELITSLNLLEQAELITEMGSWVYFVPTGEFKWSEGMYRLFGMKDRPNVRPEIYFDFTPAEQRGVVSKIVNKIQKDFQGFEETITIISNETDKRNLYRKNRKTVKIKAEVIKDKNGNPDCVVGVDLDISENVEKSQKLISLDKTLVLRNKELANAISELKTFNHIAANDYQDTLKNLYTSMEFLITNDAKNLSNSGKANIRRAQAAIQKMKLLTNDIVNYSKLQSLDTELTLVDLKKVINAEIYYQSQRIQNENVKVNIGELPIIEGYPLLLSLLFHHILTNSIKFKKENVPPEINITSHTKHGNEIMHEHSLPDMEYAIINFTDNGIGFNEEFNEMVFDMFYRLHDKIKYKGSGVGLTICKKIMSLHNGFMTAHGGENGVTIACYFPLKPEKHFLPSH